MRALTVFAATGLGVASILVGPAAIGQNDSPFTIRRPPDGATVRENVRVEVPMASIPEGGYIAYSVDGKFRTAVAPTDEQRQKAPNGVFTYIWNTKQPFKTTVGEDDPAPADGDHIVSAALYGPGQEGATTTLQTTSVHVTLANKPNVDPGPIHLRYSFKDGTDSVYNRNGQSVIVSGLTQGMQGSEDQELVSQQSKLIIDVEDRYADGSAMVRNKLTTLKVRQAGTETAYPPDQLPGSLYQQLDADGHVLYENANPTFDQFAQLGVPVETTINLPILPAAAVRVGDKWQSDGVRLDIPGTAPEQQPKVTLTSTFEGLEWQGGYPTARIHQEYNSGLKGNAAKSIMFGAVEVQRPSIKFSRDIYIAYRSGTLIKMTRTLEVTGKTSQTIGNTGGSAPGLGSSMGASTGGSFGQAGMTLGSMGGGTAQRFRSMGGAGGAGQTATSGGYPGGAGGSAMEQAMMARQGGGPSGNGGMMQAMMQARGGFAGTTGGPKMGAGLGASAGGLLGSALKPQALTQITLRSTTTTELAH